MATYSDNRIAVPEKALLDTVYISTRKGRRFVSLPELDARLNAKRIDQLVRKQIPRGRIRNAVLTRLALLGVVRPPG